MKGMATDEKQRCGGVCVYLFPAFTPSGHVYLEEEQEMVISYSGEWQTNISVGFIVIEILWMVLI